MLKNSVRPCSNSAPNCCPIAAHSRYYLTALAARLPASQPGAATRDLAAVTTALAATLGG